MAVVKEEKTVNMCYSDTSRGLMSASQVAQVRMYILRSEKSFLMCLSALYDLF